MARTKALHPLSVIDFTGKTAQEYIQLKIIDAAKEKIFDRGKSITQITYELGFKGFSEIGYKLAT